MASANKQDAVVIDQQLAASILPRREADDHKWSVGGLVIVGGAPGYIGAPALSARAAIRSGAGIVSIAAARSSVGAIASLVPEATFLILPEGEPAAAAAKAVDVIRERLDRSAALVVGPGLSDDEHATSLLNALTGFSHRHRGGSFGFGTTRESTDAAAGTNLLGGETPAVVDADGLNWLANQSEWWTKFKPMSMILTPHPGEMARLTGTSGEEIVANSQKHAVAAAKRWKQVVLLKGSRAILTDGASVFTGESIPLSLASAGTGDVLAGTIGAFLAQGLSLLDAGCLAIHTGTQAARAIEREYGTLGLIASDLPDAIGRELASLERDSAT